MELDSFHSTYLACYQPYTLDTLITSYTIIRVCTFRTKMGKIRTSNNPKKLDENIGRIFRLVRNFSRRRQL
jgi:hypothetical protein